MKRKFGTIVLFVLLLLTAVALSHISAPQSTIGSTEDVKRVTAAK